MAPRPGYLAYWKTSFTQWESNPAMRTAFISQFLREKEVPATVTVYQSGIPNHNTRDNIPLNGIRRNPCSPDHRLSLICLFKGVIQGRMIPNAHRLWITLSCKPILYEKSQSLVILACIVCFNGITWKKKYFHL